MRNEIHRLAMGALAAMALIAGPAAARERLAPEQQLDKLLQGRVAGTPVDCISLHEARQSQVIDRTAIVYDTGGVLYVNRPDNPRALNDDDILVTELRGTSQLCSIDVIKLRDRYSFFYDGFVSLGKFVPYRRVAAN